MKRSVTSLLLLHLFFASTAAADVVTGYGGTHSGTKIYPGYQEPLRDIVRAGVYGTCGGLLGGNSKPENCTFHSAEWVAAADGGPRWRINLWSKPYKRVFYGGIVKPRFGAGTPAFDTRKNHGPCPDGSCFGGPINGGTGARFERREEFRGHGPFPLRFAWIYSSDGIGSTALTADASLGTHRMHNYARRLQATADVVHVLREDGNVEAHRRSGSVWYAEDGVGAELSATRDATGNVVEWRRLAEDGEVETYDPSGHLVGLASRDGFVQVLEYDPAGKLRAVRDPLGRALGFEYADATGRLVRLLLPDGNVIAFAYDGSGAGNLVEVTYPDGERVEFRYDEPGSAPAGVAAALTGELDDAGTRVATTRYDTAGRAIATERANGLDAHNATYVLATDGNYVGSATSTDSLGKSETFDHAIFHGQVKVVGHSVRCTGCLPRDAIRTYDQQGRLDQVTDFRGVVTDHDYDLYGLPTRRVRAFGTPDEQVETTTWDRARRLPLQVDRPGQRLTYGYNARGQVVSVRFTDLTAAAAPSRTATNAYCEQAGVDAGDCARVGLLLSIDGPRSEVADVTRFVHRLADAPGCATAASACSYRRGDLWKWIDATGAIIEVLAYDGAGRRTSIRDANGVVIDYEYSPRGRLVARKVRGSEAGIEADDAITRVEYDYAGRVQRLELADGGAVQFDYDPAGRLETITDALGNQIRYGLDAVGHRTREERRDADGALHKVQAMIFDALGQLAQVRNAAGDASLYAYDVAGGLDLFSDALGRSTDQDFDALGRLTRLLRDAGGIGATSSFGYDGRDNLVRVTDPKGLDTRYTYDGFDQLVGLDSPDTGIATFAYDAAGHRTSALNARGILLRYTFDAIGRPTSSKGPNFGQDIAFAYDLPPAECAPSERFGVGRLARMTDGSGSTTYCYDRHGKVVRKVQAVQGGSTLSIGATYNGAGRLVAITYPSGAIVIYGRNANGQVTRVDAKPSPTTAQVTLVDAARYAPFGPLSEIAFGNGRTQQRRFDLDYGIDAITESGGGDGYAADYSLGAAGNTTALTERDRPTHLYDYDGLYRLGAVRSGGATLEAFSHDPTGNRLSRTNGGVTQVYDYAATSHRLLAVGGTTRAYDGNGNSSRLDNLTLAHDDRNRLQEVRIDGVLRRTHRYNGHGERVLRVDAVDSAHTRQYIYDDAGHLLGEYDAAGLRVAEYVWLDDLLVGVLKTHDGSALQYVETDHVGTPRAVIHPARNVAVWRWDATGSAFGDHHPTADPDGNGMAYDLALRFPGQYNDGIGQIAYNYYRDYDAGTGRYLQSDPIGLEGGPSTFEYAHGNPLQHIDPLGLSTLTMDRENNTLRLQMRDGQVRVFAAGNNTTNPAGDPFVVGSHGPAPHGKYPVQRPIETRGNVSYGDYFWPVGAVDADGDPADIARRRGIGVHCGRRDHLSRTEGCIRLDNDGCGELFDATSEDPIESITIN